MPSKKSKTPSPTVPKGPSTEPSTAKETPASSLKRSRSKSKPKDVAKSTPAKSTSADGGKSTADIVSGIMATQEALHGAQKKAANTGDKRTVQTVKDNTRKRKSTASMPRIPRKKPQKAHSVSASGDDTEEDSSDDRDTSSDTDSGESDGISEDSDFEGPQKTTITDFCDLLKSNEKSDSVASGLEGCNMEMLKIMNEAFKKQQECGPAINETLGERVQSELTDFATAQDLIDIEKLTFRPENCPSMVVPQLNPELWQTVYNHKITKIRDQGLQQVQQLILQSMVPVVRIMDNLIKGKTDDKAVMKDLSLALKIQGFASTTLTYKRRQSIKPRLDNVYATQLVSKQNKPSTLLFGDDFIKKSKDIKETAAVAKTFSKKSRDYNKGSGNQNDNKSKNWGKKQGKYQKGKGKGGQGKKSKKNWKN